MCRFAKCCASFVLALLLSFVSLVPCFAETITDNVNTSKTECTVMINTYGESDTSWDVFDAPTSTMVICDGMTFEYDEVGIAPQFWTASQFLFEEDKTLYWNIYPVVTYDSDDGVVHWQTNNLTSKLPQFYVGVGYTDPSVSSQAQQLMVSRVALGNQNLDGIYSNTFRVTIPSKSPNGNYNNNFSCLYPTGVTTRDGYWYVTDATGHTLLYYIDMFQFVDTSDSAILAVLDNILAEAEEANLNLSNILTACNTIITELRELGADTLLIRECIERLESLSATQLNFLDKIDTNVEAIYYFLTEALKSESDDLSAEAGQISGEIDNTHAAEEYYQTSMQGSYDSLDLENFTFGGIAGGLELVGVIFSDIWDSFGTYSIIFSFPLVLGIALLAIGKISKYDTQKRRREAYEQRRAERSNYRKGKGG